MDQDYGIARAMIFVIKFDLAGVFLTNINVWHCDSPCLLFISEVYELRVDGDCDCRKIETPGCDPGPR